MTKFELTRFLLYAILLYIDINNVLNINFITQILKINEQKKMRRKRLDDM